MNVFTRNFQEDDNEQGIVIVTENEQGYVETGITSPNARTANALCGKLNDALGVSPEDAKRIVDASMHSALSTSELLEALNSYDGNNIWQDLILFHADEERTAEIDEGRSDRFAMPDGRAFIWREDLGRIWIQSND